MFGFLLSVFLVITFSELSYSKCPNGIINKGLNAKQQNFILQKHNEFRSLIAEGKLSGQPQGTNLKKMKYSQELQKKAQDIANTCEEKYQNITGTEWKNVGQSFSTVKFKKFNNRQANWNGTIHRWFDEHKEYKFGDLNTLQSKHYAQIVWAETDNVGCGFSYFRKKNNYYKLYVCYYGPGGNVIGKLPYEEVKYEIPEDKSWSSVPKAVLQYIREAVKHLFSFP